MRKHLLVVLFTILLLVGLPLNSIGIPYTYTANGTAVDWNGINRSINATMTVDNQLVDLGYGRAFTLKDYHVNIDGLASWSGRNGQLFNSGWIDSNTGAYHHGLREWYASDPSGYWSTANSWYNFLRKDQSYYTGLDYANLLIAGSEIALPHYIEVETFIEQFSTRNIVYSKMTFSKAAPVPEPSTLGLMALGTVLLTVQNGIRNRRNRLKK